MREDRQVGTEKLPASTQKLLNALEKAGASSAFVVDVGKNVYHDFMGSRDFPMIDLVNRMRAEGLEDLALRAASGEFDATKEEADDWAESEDGRTTISGLTNPKGEAS